MMRKLYFTIILIGTQILCNTNLSAQTGLVYTVAGGGSSTSDGVPAISAFLLGTSGVGLDAWGNVYFTASSVAISSQVKKVDGLTGIITSIAGNGIMGFSGDGGPATSATIRAEALCADLAGNVYISDSFSRIREIDVVTGIITTIAGTGSSVFSGDGGPASAASFRRANAMCMDAAGNMYISDYSRIRKISATTGIISTIAGGASLAYSGDGVPATAASLNAMGICMDGAGNIYFADEYNNRVRKINGVTGIITTIAGDGNNNFSGDGGLATAAEVGMPHSVAVDAWGNVYVAQQTGNRIRKITTSGIINTYAGGGASTADGVNALSATMTPYFLAMDAVGNLHYSNNSDKIRKVMAVPTLSSDSFVVYINKLCTGPRVTIGTLGWSSGYVVNSSYGDGTSDTHAISSYSAGGGNAVFDHVYTNPGTYTVKHVLMNGTAAIDSETYSYTQITCNSLPIRIYGEQNLDCIKNPTEISNYHPIEIAVDSNGIALDTFSVISGLYYNALGPVGTVYSFRAISPNYLPVCPSSGVIIDTIQAPVFARPDKYVGLACGSSTDFDLTQYVMVGTSPDALSVHIMCRNLLCNSVSGSVHFKFSPKYKNSYTSTAFSPSIHPTPTLSYDNYISWDFPPISSAGASIHGYGFIPPNPSMTLVLGDTVRTSFLINPLAGDMDTTNNYIERVDTIQASFDPNIIQVSPRDCFDNDTTLLYSVHFENMGNDTAHNVYVLDTLSANLDVKSLKLLATSAVMDINTINAGPYTILKFDFPNIKLLDSSWHGLNDGMFVFSLKTKPGLAIGESIANRVGIYFDNNDVVMTNTVQNTKGCPTVMVDAFTANNNVLLYPNPAKDELTLNTKRGSFSSCTITNAIGQQVITQDIAGTQTLVNIKSLPSGVYQVTLKGAQFNEVVKFVKW
jgi:uncharacterized repeat protein (TIGR01451 family)